ncbi:LuxR C-terminal-related transcriptional regulator [Streptomyces canus]|uniref:LuxR C-terminal-related transcriptional regulator n=1 Tax=Streptomyces canus TaxID=58343 RepID=UPI0036F10605
MTIRVVVVDDQDMVRSGFAALLSAQCDIDVVGEAPNGRLGIEVGRSTHPDVVLMDVRMPVMLMLTTFDLDDYVYEALHAGASGFLLKDAPVAELVQAVRVVAAGEALLAPSVTRRLIEDVARRRPVPRRDLRLQLNGVTPRETEVLLLVAQGLSNAEIAARLVVAEQTVKTHMTRLLTKLAARDRAQLVVLAYESGLVAPGKSHSAPGA